MLNVAVELLSYVEQINILIECDIWMLFYYDIPQYEYMGDTMV